MSKCLQFLNYLIPSFYEQLRVNTSFLLQTFSPAHFSSLVYPSSFFLSFFRSQLGPIIRDHYSNTFSSYYFQMVPFSFIFIMPDLCNITEFIYPNYKVLYVYPPFWTQVYWSKRRSTISWINKICCVLQSNVSISSSIQVFSWVYGFGGFFCF